MSCIHFEITDKKEIERLGFEYAEDDSKCQLHRFNNVPVEIDLRDYICYDYNALENNLNAAFKDILIEDIKLTGVKKIRSITWDRIFVIGESWDVRQFTARFWVRIEGEDSNTTDGHVCMV